MVANLIFDTMWQLQQLILAQALTHAAHQRRNIIDSIVQTPPRCHQPAYKTWPLLSECCCSCKTLNAALTRFGCAISIECSLVPDFDGLKRRSERFGAFCCLFFLLFDSLSSSFFNSFTNCFYHFSHLLLSRLALLYEWISSFAFFLLLLLFDSRISSNHFTTSITNLFVVKRTELELNIRFMLVLHFVSRTPFIRFIFFNS